VRSGAHSREIVKLFLCLTKYHVINIHCLTKYNAIKMYWGMDVYFHAYLTAALDGGEWSASKPGRFTPLSVD